MNNAARIAIVTAAVAGLVACTVAPEESEHPSASVQGGDVDPNLARLPPIGGTSSGMVVITTDYPPTSCGPYCAWKAATATTPEGCQCPTGNGFDFVSTVACPYAHPCARYVLGVVRCYDRNSWGSC